MQFQIILAFLTTTLVTFERCQASSVPVTISNIPPLCEPGIIEEMPPHIKKVCVALENSTQLSKALNSYIRNEAEGLMFRAEDLASGPSPGKRTDVDHVFLRFGRRR